MTVTPILDRRMRRHMATRDEILQAAWDLAASEGVAGITLRELAARAGMRQPSLYTYFPSKQAIYDAMFGQGWQALLDRLRSLDLPPAAGEGLRLAAHVFVDFCLEDPARFMLMCERPIPGFEPSPEAYRPADEALQSLSDALVRWGIPEPSAVDLWTALLTGLVNQQVANDPGGERWIRLVDEATDMFLEHVTRTRRARR